MAQNAGAHLGFWLDQALGGKRFHRLAQNGAGYAEAQRQFMIARKDGPFGNGPRDDAAPQFTHHDRVAVMPLAPGNGRFQQSQFMPPSRMSLSKTGSRFRETCPGYLLQSNGREQQYTDYCFRPPGRQRAAENNVGLYRPCVCTDPV